MPVTKPFTCLNTFVGYGNPEAPIWFVGIDDGSRTDGWPADSGPDIVRDYSPPNNPSRWFSVSPDQIVQESRTTRIYNYMSDILRRLCVGTEDVIDRQTYRNTVLANNYFQMNVRSLALHRNTDWPTHYSALFGISRKEYEGLLLQERYPRLRNFHARHQPNFTICFGKGHWERFEQMLGLSSSARCSLSPHVEYHSEQKVFLTPFFGQCGRPLGCLSYSMLDGIVDTIMNEGISSKKGTKPIR